VTPGPFEYVEEAIVVDGVLALRRRKIPAARKVREPYLHIPMSCVTALARAKIPSTAWPLALAVLQHHIVAGRAAEVTAAFASRAGVGGRAARRYAIAALAGSGLFHVRKDGKRATKVSPTSRLKTETRDSQA
jgi:hypothetical protein